jgi:light-harvesting complex 1 beta chain
MMNAAEGEIDMADKPAMNPTGLSDDEAKEVHAYFMKGATLFGGAALVAHLLAWSWLPWFPG